MKKLTPVISVIEDKCINCHSCIAACPIKFCNDGSGDHVKVNHDTCIGCGACIVACTHEARVGVDDTEKFFEGLRRRERIVTVVGQLSILAALIALAGPWVAFKVYMVPYFLVFPVAFVLNRLGQHYDVDPSDPARWSTLMAPSRLWDFVYLWSSYHLEHHYFPNVPFYNLRALHERLRPFFAERGMVPTTYRRLLWQWFVENRPPHADWRAGSERGGAPAGPPEVPALGRP
jgi:fatty acid desaturase